MYYKLSEADRQNKRGEYRKNSIYKILYTPLWRQRGDDLSPEDVWEEANNLAFKLKSVKEDFSLIVAEEFDDMCQRYSSIRTVDGEVSRRTFSQAEHSSMMVCLTAFLLLANIYPEAKGHPYLKICQSLTDVSCHIHGYKEIYEEARQIEDEYERKGVFIEAGDLIEQIKNKESTLSPPELVYLHKVMGDIIDEHRNIHIDTMRENERILSRVNDRNHHCIQSELDRLRDNIKKLEGNNSVRSEYKNIIFDKKYADRVSDIRQAIYPFVKDGVDHIDTSKQNQWLAIVEPLRKIDGLLITHDERPRRRDCTNDEICQQMKIFFGDDLKSLDFSKIPKSISAARGEWEKEGVGLTYHEWKKYYNTSRSSTKYKSLARIASRVYGEVLKVIGR